MVLALSPFAHPLRIPAYAGMTGLCKEPVEG